jgi:hypothetical protein
MGLLTVNVALGSGVGVGGTGVGGTEVGEAGCGVAVGGGGTGVGGTGVTVGLTTVAVKVGRSVLVGRGGATVGARLTRLPAQPVTTIARTINRIRSRIRECMLRSSPLQ